ncbi:MAG: aminotransferase class I/II-fold pyridoxal phosphate-dependent enzyme, partial [Solirubrobacterales bacterium]|nr:aminotransferase class I/II-fold pyridoxal phosphate-dependent enzyme [Solirubrobacterales bacterium]
MQASGAPISFARGAPSLDIVDVQGLSEAAHRAFADDPAATVGYGTAVGFAPLRAWIAERHGVAPEQVLVTNGSMQADAFLFSLLVDAGDAVVVEAPTYDRTLLNLRGRGADLHPIALETDGIDVDALERLLRSGIRPTLAHIIPNFQNPAGYT